MVPEYVPVNKNVPLPAGYLLPDSDGWIGVDELQWLPKDQQIQWFGFWQPTLSLSNPEEVNHAG